MRNLNMEQATKLAKTVLRVGTSLYLLKSFGYFNNVNLSIKRKTEATNYYEVVDVIVKSDMLNSYKENMIELVENNREPGYYKTVAGIVNSDMLSSRKITMIKALSDK